MSITAAKAAVEKAKREFGHGSREHQDAKRALKALKAERAGSRLWR